MFQSLYGVFRFRGLRWTLFSSGWTGGKTERNFSMRQVTLIPYDTVRISDTPENFSTLFIIWHILHCESVKTSNIVRKVFITTLTNEPWSTVLLVSFGSHWCSVTKNLLLEFHSNQIGQRFTKFTHRIRILCDDFEIISDFISIESICLTEKLIF